MLLCKIELSGIDEYALGYKAYNLYSGYLKSACGSCAAYFLVGDMKRDCAYVGNVHRYLGDAVFVYVPTNCLATFKGSGNPYLVAVGVLQKLAGKGASFACLAAFFAYVKGNGHCAAGRGSIQVVIYCNKKVACAYIGGSGLCYDLVILCRAEVRLLCGVCNLVWQGLVFPGTAYSQVLALRFECCGLIAVAGDAKLFVKPFCQAPGQNGTFFQGDICYRDKGQYVSCSASRMGSVVKAHVNQFLSLFCALKSGFQDGLRRAYECYNRAVGGFSGVYVKNLYLFSICRCFFDCGNN